MYAIEEINDSVITVDIRSRLLSDRMLFLDGDITRAMVNDIIMSLLFLDSKQSDPITLYISSNGGSVSSGLSLINVMKTITADVNTVVLDEAMSMAAVILMCGASRSALRDSVIMLHGISIRGCNGNIESVNSLMENIVEQNERIVEIIKEQTRLPDNRIKELMTNDNYINSQTALDLGLIDKII